jgi:hypothetical protein
MGAASRFLVSTSLGEECGGTSTEFVNCYRYADVSSPILRLRAGSERPPR